MAFSYLLRTATVVLLSLLTLRSVWNDDPSSYMWLALTIVAAIAVVSVEAMQGPSPGLAKYKGVGFSVVAMIISGHSLLFYGFPLVVIVSIFLGLVVLTRFIGGAQALLVSMSLIAVTLFLNVAVKVTGLATSMYYRPHEMLATYDGRFGSVYQRHAHVRMTSLHGDIQAVDNVGIYEPREIEFVTDGLGFRNVHDYHGQRYVLVGDSFLAGNGSTQACILSEQLHTKHGIDTYNLGYTGDLAAYYRRIKAFQNIYGNNFKAVLFFSEGNDFVGWDDPSSLSNTSAFGYRAFFKSNSLWRYTRWLYNRLSRKGAPKSPVLVVGSAPVAFYSGHRDVVRNHKDLDEKVVRFSQVLRDLKDAIVHIFFIPDKYRIYYSFIRQASDPVNLPHKQWEYLEQSARQAGIPATDLTQPLTEAARKLLAEGRYVFWRDDTHWNCEGMAVAADEVARILKSK